MFATAGHRKASSGSRPQPSRWETSPQRRKRTVSSRTLGFPGSGMESPVTVARCLRLSWALGQRGLSLGKKEIYFGSFLAESPSQSYWLGHSLIPEPLLSREGGPPRRDRSYAGGACWGCVSGNGAEGGVGHPRESDKGDGTPSRRVPGPLTVLRGRPVAPPCTLSSPSPRASARLPRQPCSPPPRTSLPEAFLYLLVWPSG